MIRKIISGGQTGVDRAALDFAIARGIAHGGFCPRGRRSESGPIAAQYLLDECASPAYALRTALNVSHSDGTLIMTRGCPSSGTLKTIGLCVLRDKPRFLVLLDHPLEPEAFAAWIAAYRIATLNVAGPRESKQRGVGAQAYTALEVLFRPCLA